MSVVVLAAVVQAWWHLLKLHAFHPDVDQASKLLWLWLCAMVVVVIVAAASVVVVPVAVASVPP